MFWSACQIKALPTAAGHEPAIIDDQTIPSLRTLQHHQRRSVAYGDPGVGAGQAQFLRPMPQVPIELPGQTECTHQVAGSSALDRWMGAVENGHSHRRQQLGERSTEAPRHAWPRADNGVGARR